MLLVGLTGGMGSGKSTITPWIAALGWQVIDADQLAREVLAPGTPGLCEVVELLGEQVLDAEGALRRSEVARLVFADPPLLKTYEGMVHRRIREEKNHRLRQIAAQEAEPKVVYVAPLLFEANLQKTVQKTVLVVLDPKAQLQRLQEKRKLPLEDIQRRLAAQMPLEEKILQADFLIDNNGPLEQTKAQVERLFAELALLEPWTLERALQPC